MNKYCAVHRFGGRSVLGGIAFSLLAMGNGSAIAQTTPEAGVADGATQPVIVVTGARRARSITEAAVPVDVVDERQLDSIISSDLQDKLAQTVPSYSVQTKPLYGALIFVRPASLRGLNPDQTLVLVNGKRLHRTAFVNFNILGGGSQGADLSQVSSSALSRAEVLRDGASAQYGSDAIAGVINLILKNEPGYSAFAQGSQYYAGDGENIQVGIDGGWALDDRGQLNASFEYTHGNATSRSLQRAEATALIAAGNTNVRQPAVTTWGQPEVRTYRFSANGSYDLSDAVSLYGYALYGDSWGESNLNWRSPNSASLARSRFQDGPGAIYPAYSAVSRFPGGFTPFFGIKGKDLSSVIGLKGKLNDRLTYDLSGTYGFNKLHFVARDTLNPSLGPLSPTKFDGGRAKQQEWIVNADFVQLVDLGLEKPVNLAFGGEYRRERFSVTAGEFASYAVGPLSDLPSGSGGQVGILPDAAGSWARSNVSAYIDIDSDLSKAFNIGLAGRYEHYSDFGSTVNGKLSARYHVADGLSLRGAVSTGFRAPTPGQSNSTNTQQSPDPTRPGQIFVISLLPPANPISQSFGAKPLKPEKSVNLSAGFVLDPLPGLSLTADYYLVRVKDRLAISQFFEPVVGTRYSFFVNGYTTRTQGIDLVASYRADLAADTGLSLTGAFNYNDTKVTRSDPGVVSNAQRIAIERRLPHISANAAATLRHGRFEVTARMRYYGSTIDLFFDTDAFKQKIGDETFVDLSATYDINNHLRLTIGAENLFNEYPDRVNWGGPLSSTNYLDFGRKYPSALPFSTDGGRYYARASVSF